jgi:hypothetical protein
VGGGDVLQRVMRKLLTGDGNVHCFDCGDKSEDLFICPISIFYPLNTCGLLQLNYASIKSVKLYK